MAGNIGYDDWLTVDDYRRVFDVNALGVIRVTHAFKDLVKQSRLIAVIALMGNFY